jgi:hypothetical protein
VCDNFSSSVDVGAILFKGLCGDTTRTDWRNFEFI